MAMLACLLVLAYCWVDVESKDDCMRFGAVFPIPLEQNNVHLDCTGPQGRPLCCSAVDDSVSRGVGWEDMSAVVKEDKDLVCQVTRKYKASPYEREQLDLAWRLQNVTDWEARSSALVENILSVDSQTHSKKWLKRVKAHMKHNDGVAVSISDNDHHYLSKYIVTRTCNDKSKNDQWIEWIEPLTIHARHPFGMSTCKRVRKPPFINRSNVDYVLIQSAENLGRSRVGTARATRGGSGRKQKPPKHYFLDAGTSTFDSSLWWFTCAYAQMGISFNDVYGWEKTLLHPEEYWSKVPEKWKGHWHFYNVPITSNSSSRAVDSPLGMLKQMSHPQDFVAFKLDIDWPLTEMPIAASLLRNPEDNVLVDEFFFELHFRCEVMMSVNGAGNGCGWGQNIPSEREGIILDRPHVLSYFRDLRETGIRAHFWP